MDDHQELADMLREVRRTVLDALYRSILAQPLNDELRGVVESLIRVEERDIVMLKKCWPCIIVELPG